MSDDPQAPEPSADGAPASETHLIPVRYTGAHGLIVNGQGIGPGDIVHLPQEEVAQWPDPHPYYERADAAEAPTPSAPEGGEQELTTTAAEAAGEDAAAVPGSA